jgi:DNA-binding FadR family transcriptional regulator
MSVGSLKRLEPTPPLHISVQASLKRFIADNDLPGGAGLPAELELARALGVSRNSVREAVRALESVGILETRRGVGVFVREFSLEPLLAHLTYGLDRDLHGVSEILDIRRTLEVAMIESAMARLTDVDQAELAATLDAMEARARRGLGFPDEDRAFHRVLFRGLRNRVMLRLIDAFWLAFHNASGFFEMADSDPVATWRDHAEILAAVRAHDPAAARARLELHYQGIAQSIQNTLKG